MREREKEGRESKREKEREKGMSGVSAPLINTSDRVLQIPFTALSFSLSLSLLYLSSLSLSLIVSHFVLVFDLHYFFSLYLVTLSALPRRKISLHFYDL